MLNILSFLFSDGKTFFSVSNSTKLNVQRTNCFWIISISTRFDFFSTFFFFFLFRSFHWKLYHLKIESFEIVSISIALFQIQFDIALYLSMIFVVFFSMNFSLSIDQLHCQWSFTSECVLIACESFGNLCRCQCANDVFQLNRRHWSMVFSLVYFMFCVFSKFELFRCLFWNACRSALSHWFQPGDNNRHSYVWIRHEIFSLFSVAQRFFFVTLFSSDWKHNNSML